jgi:hypothetical protein
MEEDKEDVDGRSIYVGNVSFFPRPSRAVGHLE